MPTLLKRETRQRLEASQRALLEALRLAQTPQTNGDTEGYSEGALEIGLLGTAGELALNACLFEVLGRKGIVRDTDGFFLTASHALDRFRKLLDTRIPKVGSLTKGVQNPGRHLELLKTQSCAFSVLFTMRAAGLHGGAGVSRDVVFHSAANVSQFLLLLATSKKWAPYLKNIAYPPVPLKEKTLLIDELTKLAKKGAGTERVKALSGIFLVLPALPDDPPKWLDSLKNVQVTPKTKDIAVLVQAISKASVGEFSKVGKGIQSVPVKIVGKDDPDAIAVYTSNVKKQFDNIYDEWRASIGSSNTALEKRIFSVPHIQSIYDFFAIGLKHIGIPEEELDSGLSAHDLWPFIASSLGYQGIPGPCFFLAKRLKERESGQLKALLENAGKLKKKLRDRTDSYFPALEACATSKAISRRRSLIANLVADSDEREQSRERLLGALKRKLLVIDKNEAKEAERILAAVEIEEEVAAGTAKLIEYSESLPRSRNPLARLLCAASINRDDVGPLASMFRDSGFEQVYSDARKAIRAIDFSLYGPKLSQ